MRREKWRKMYLICSLLVIASLFLMGVMAGPVSAQSELKYPKIVRFSSLSPGTLLYILISGLCKVASNNSPMTVVVVPTAGAYTWLPMMTKQGTIESQRDSAISRPIPRPQPFESSMQGPRLK